MCWKTGPKPFCAARDIFFEKTAKRLLRSPAAFFKSAFTGSLAQLVERFVYTEDVGSSSLSRPTISP